MNHGIEPLSVKRVYRQSQEAVFRAWTVPERLQKWFCPNPEHRVVADVDLREGGNFLFQMIPTSGEAWVIGGEYREVDPPNRLSFTWKWTTDPTEGYGSMVNVYFRPTSGGTEVEVLHDELESEESRTNHTQGWNRCMDRLTDYLDDPIHLMANPI